MTDHSALIAEAKAHIEKLAHGIPGSQADRVRRGENADPRTSLIVRLTQALSEEQEPISEPETSEAPDTRRRNKNVPTVVLERMRTHSEAELQYWKRAKVETERSLDGANRMIKVREAEIEEFSAELQYRRDHPDTEKK